MCLILCITSNALSAVLSYIVIILQIEQIVQYQNVLYLHVHLKEINVLASVFIYLIKKTQLQYGRRNGRFNIYTSITHLNVQLYIHCLSKDHQISSFWVIFLSSVVKILPKRVLYSIILVYITSAY